MLLLLHSAWVGPASWRPTADALIAMGLDVALPDLRPAVPDVPPYHPAVAATAARFADGAGEVDVIAHSAAGSTVPLVVEALGGRARSAVFVDARLPHPNVSWFGALPDAIADQLRSTVRDGRVSSWDSWFGPEILEPLLPDPAVRREVLADLPRLPLAMAEEPFPDVDLPDGFPAAYLTLSPGYAEETRRARELGWPVTEIEADHLATVTRAAEVADALVGLLRRASRS